MTKRKRTKGQTMVKKKTKTKKTTTKQTNKQQYTEITDLTTRFPQKPKVNCGRVSSSCSTSGTRRVNHVTHVSGIMSMVRGERHDPLATSHPAPSRCILHTDNG